MAKRLQYCNWVQALEGDIDQSHVSFAHRRLDAGTTGHQAVDRSLIDGVEGGLAVARPDHLEIVLAQERDEPLGGVALPVRDQHDGLLLVHHGRVATAPPRGESEARGESRRASCGRAATS